MHEPMLHSRPDADADADAAARGGGDEEAKCCIPSCSVPSSVVITDDGPFDASPLPPQPSVLNHSANVAVIVAVGIPSKRHEISSPQLSASLFCLVSACQLCYA